MPPTIHVMQSAPTPKPTTNPYIVMLSRGLNSHPGVELTHFSWTAALTRRVDVFHAHWPEILVSGSTPLRKLVRQALFVCLLAKFALTQTAIIRTVHNLELPEGISRREVALLRLFERLTTFSIRINATTALPDMHPSATILHGHYRDWFSGFPRPDAVYGQLTYFGLIRRYKGTEALIRVFTTIPDRDPALRLTVAGRPSTPELVEELTALAADDDAVTLRLAFLADGELVDLVGRANLIVLPYREMHNSGGALTALSLDRPVLVPDNAVNRALRAEVGEQWVRTYKGELTPEQLISALEATALPLAGVPNLDQRDWTTSTELHVRAYHEALRSKGRLRP